MRWPKVIAAGRTVHDPASLLDLYPSLLQLWGIELPTDRVLDGVSLWPSLPLQSRPSALQQTPPPAPREYLFHYCGSTVTAVRWGRYKAHRWTTQWDAGLHACPSITICDCKINRHEPPLLYDIDEDPAEERPLNASLPQHQDALRHMLAAVAVHERGIEPVVNQLERAVQPWLFPCCGAERMPWWRRWYRVATGTCHCD